jgi:lysophospholipase
MSASKSSMKKFLDWDEPAHLVEMAKSPAPKNNDVGYIFAPDGKRLRVGIFWPDKKPKATIILMSGYSECIEKYFETIQNFLDRDYCVCMPEWRGHGLSDRMSSDRVRLHLEDFDINAPDLILRVERVTRDVCPAPYYGVAHSMGGQIALRGLLLWPDMFKKLALCAPMIDVPVPPITRAVLSVLGFMARLRGNLDRYAPGDPPSRTPERPNQNWVTYDEERYAQGEALLREDTDLQVNGRSLGWTISALKIMQDTARPEVLRSIDCPIFFGIAADEHLVKNAAIERAVGYLPNAKSKVYPKARHELFMELDVTRDEFIEDIDRFLMQSDDA